MNKPDSCRRSGTSFAHVNGTSCGYAIAIDQIKVGFARTNCVMSFLVVVNDVRPSLLCLRQWISGLPNALVRSWTFIGHLPREDDNSKDCEVLSLDKCPKMKARPLSIHFNLFRIEDRVLNPLADPSVLRPGLISRGGENAKGRESLRFDKNQGIHDAFVNVAPAEVAWPGNRPPGESHAKVCVNSFGTKALGTESWCS
jgi:hypothetical protein